MRHTRQPRLALQPTMKDLVFRTATDADLPRILEIIRQAQRRMAAAGSQQWQDGYPAPTNIASDLAHGYGHVICRPEKTVGEDGPNVRETADTTGPELDTTACGSPVQKPESVIAYGAIVFDGEPAYEALDGQWLTAGPYVVVHRLAVADEALGNGIGTEFLNEAARMALRRGIHAFRIDTNFDNHRMLRILSKNGFTRCGKVLYRSGEREAFEKCLSPGNNLQTRKNASRTTK